MAGKNDPLKGKSIEELANLDLDVFLGMKRDEMARTVTRLSSAANKRLRGLEKLDIESPALKSVQKSGGRFTTIDKGGKPKNLNQLRSEYMRVTKFLKMQTSSRRSFKRVSKEVRERLGFSKEASENLMKAFWSTYNKMPEADYFRDNRGAFGSKETQIEIARLVEIAYDSTEDYDTENARIKIFNAVSELRRKEYENQNDVSNFDPSSMVRLL